MSARIARYLVPCCILLAGASLAGNPANTENDSQLTARVSQDTRDDACDGLAPAVRGGRMAYLDPATGRLVAEPPYGVRTLEMTPEALYMFSSSNAGLVSWETPDGGVAMHLQGRFRQGTVATVQEDGGITTRGIGGEIFASPIGRCIQQTLPAHGTETVGDP